MLSFSRSKVSGRAVDHQDAQIKSQIVDRLSSAIMTIDRDFIVTYVNEPPRELAQEKRNGISIHLAGFQRR